MSRARGLSLALAAAGAQLIAGAIATVANRNLWPVCSYNMFNDALERNGDQLLVDLLTPQGWDAGHPAAAAYPVPFFRANQVFAHLVVAGEPEEQVRFAHRVIDRLNHRRWRAFDEIRAPAATARPVRGIRVRVREHRATGGSRETFAFEHTCSPGCPG
ncbi:MAG: hypothetical protein V9G19_18500 [Tetrasphaera sp.]